LVRTKLEEGWSPEQIAGRLGREGKLRISHESIYSYIWRDKRAGGSLHRCLRQSSKLRRKRRNSRDSRGRLPGKRHISERPTSATGRKTIGHWEVDTVLGSTKACIATLVERKTGYVLLGKLGDRRMRSMSRRLKFLIRRGSAGFETITADNGSEFHGYSSVECATGVEFYFATPYHSWERGSNENFNGLLREYLPKGEDLSLVTQRDCDALARIFNRRPRKRLGYRTPEECFHG
jgi:IS30 family transposase